MKKEAPLKRQGAQKTPDEKRGTFKMLRSSKRPSMKKEAPLKHQGAKKDIRQKKDAPSKHQGDHKTFDEKEPFQDLHSRQTENQTRPSRHLRHIPR
jgi:hypothetical protein